MNGEGELWSVLPEDVVIIPTIMCTEYWWGNIYLVFVRGQPLHSTLTDVLVGNISGDCDQGTASSKPICIHFDIRFVFPLLHVYIPRW